MTRPRSEFLRAMVDRGYMYQCTDLDELDAKARASTLVAYIGFDCTAPSLHVGNLLSIMVLRWLQRTGHRPIVLMGGGTTKVGDPSGKDESRQLLSDAAIADNMASIQRTFAKFLDFGDGPTDAIMVDNAEWLDALPYISFLREYGRHFSVNRMLSLDSVKLRLDREQPLSFLEFNYVILQAYDFVELGRRYGCTLQMGGSDQWGNIVSGVDLGRRVANLSLYGLTTPLIATASGAKMGKTAAGAYWLNADQLAPYDYWQFWRDCDDADIGRFMRLYTELPLDEIARWETMQGQELNEAKKVLATEATRLCHGETAARDAAETARRTFEGGGTGAELPTIEVPRAALEAGIAVFDLLHRSGLCTSKSEARRLIKGGGARVNDLPVHAELHQVSNADIDGNGQIKLSAGKKRHVIVRAV